MSDNTEENFVSDEPIQGLSEEQFSNVDQSEGVAAGEPNPGSEPPKSNRKPRNHPDMRIFHNIKPDEQTGAIVNPRREGSFGFTAMKILIDAGEEGLTYREYVKGGGRPNDLAWDQERGHVRIVQPTDDPETAARMKEEADKIAAEKAAAKAVKAEEAAKKAALKAEADAAKKAAKAEADAAKKAAKEEADAAKKLAAEQAKAASPGQVNGATSVENADKADESRLATEAGEGPLATGDAPTTANAKGKGRGGQGKTGATNVSSSIPI